MQQEIKNDFKTDENENPTGGVTLGNGLEIRWQDGPIKTIDGFASPNGAFVEDVIQAAIDRLEFFNASKFRCRENSLAITKLEEALHWLNHRTADRQKRKVENTYEV